MSSLRPCHKLVRYRLSPPPFYVGETGEKLASLNEMVFTISERAEIVIFHFSSPFHTQTHVLYSDEI